MKKIICIIISILFLISGIALGYKHAVNKYNRIFTSDFNVNFLYTNLELRIFNFQRLMQTKSIPIEENEDPGSNPSDDFFGILGTLNYPLKEFEITDTDEIVMVIETYGVTKSNEIDAYITCNTKVIKQVKDELCYFSTSPGTTPKFHISIFKNGFVIKKNIGVFGMHLSKLGNEFKPIKKMNHINSSTFAWGTRGDGSVVLTTSLKYDTIL